jgi:hypothetical protein
MWARVSMQKLEVDSRVGGEGGNLCTVFRSGQKCLAMRYW